MSVAYGGGPGGAGYAPNGQVNFGWIGESFDLFKANVGVWLVAVLPALADGWVLFAPTGWPPGRRAPASYAAPAASRP